MKKFTLYLIVFVAIFFACINVSHAKNSHNLGNECSANGTCQTVCSISASDKSGNKYNVYIYYKTVSNQYIIRWIRSDGTKKAKEIGPDSLENVLSKNKIKYENGSFNGTSCPTNVHLTGSNGNKLCLAYSKNYCEQQSGILFNKFDEDEDSTILSAKSILEMKQNVGITTEIEDQSCESLLGNPHKEGDPAFYLRFAFSVIRYVAIILLLVLTSIDFIKSVTSSDGDELKKVIKKTTKRLILCILIFFLPTLITYVLTLMNDNAISLCGVGE